ncbi:RdgB/HAM1 family non-canonical purine NTP pyrophosphatase [Cryobacterium sp. TMT2-18-3]|uniref:RdgB/HAM1 family non-canonical purine NTP pyrophosphatase n=1 Tax=unclassified Cryobacterium TaxID=2649013 RepID=UPI00106A5355|nr:MULTISPECIES: RdgB/HAM1 family non-canonical purine NTP pyrophosphatase [unclassified Cryobacterium]TFC32152.1 RdgB/HAM1 family non-canonical purine NTP pyrophosphatase [Cryobacterium sp. TMT2-18-2]TFC38580.1 RdgB/HAM1 family non-canonical purine NTP pyrophosphatase [Cryobacterium sp. TMT2-42-4]TFC56288.1 RdgB/HAM1 family non-canonical purine NTP pyrophosphatase [Cryobacterium sp. TMT2-15-1]TFC66135.1 RdgB/HAM1 family non-canonical purine NTP pyrophosphatase [Cryobacterium sp. TMT2-18-3]
MQVVLATHNQHKVEELRRILAPRLPDLDVLAYDGPEPVEDGVTFAENALIKARAAAAHTGLPAIADDSGICVDLLGGSPGIFSARWAGPARDSDQNLQLLLWQLGDVAAEHRGGHFTCVAALAMPDGTEWHVTGEWPGRILTEPSGAGGFGYDPIFLPDGYAISAAELTPNVKNEHSHRARAFGKLIPVLETLLEA